MRLPRFSYNHNDTEMAVFLLKFFSIPALVVFSIIHYPSNTILAYVVSILRFGFIGILSAFMVCMLCMMVYNLFTTPPTSFNVTMTIGATIIYCVALYFFVCNILYPCGKSLIFGPEHLQATFVELEYVSHYKRPSNYRLTYTDGNSKSFTKSFPTKILEPGSDFQSGDTIALEIFAGQIIEIQEIKQL